MRSIKRCHFQWLWTNPDPVFNVTPLFDAINISQMATYRPTAVLLSTCSYHRSSCQAVRVCTFTSRRTIRSSAKVSPHSTCRWTRRCWHRRTPSCRRGPPRPTHPASSRRGRHAGERRLRRRRRRRNCRIITAIITIICATASNIYEWKRQDLSRENTSRTNLAIGRQWRLPGQRSRLTVKFCWSLLATIVCQTLVSVRSESLWICATDFPRDTYLTLYSAKVIMNNRIIWGWCTGRWWVGCYIWYRCCL